MIRAGFHRQFRFLVLRCSLPQWGAILLLALAVVLSGYSFVSPRHAWLIFLASLSGVGVLCLLLRTVPVVWRSLSHYRLLRHASRLSSMRHHATWQFDKTAPDLLNTGREVLLAQGYHVRQQQHADIITLSALRGRLNRLGFLLVHAAWLLILVGALLDSGLWLDWQIAAGRLKPESRQIALHEMTGPGIIGADSGMAFQGYEQLRPAQITDEVRIITPRGQLSKHLPFAVAVKSVQLDAGHTLQENNFLTRIAILDTHLDQPVTAVLGTNRPFHYQGLEIYQQDISDGGSEITLAMWPLAHARPVPLRVRTRVGAERQLQTRLGTIGMTFFDLKPRNVMLMPTAVQSPATFHNVGPSLYFRISDELDREREFINYMLPVLQEGRYFFITGVRHTGEGFRYLHIPADRQGGLTTFFNLHAALFNPKSISAAIRQVLAEAAGSATAAERKNLRTTLTDLLTQFREGGYQAVNVSLSRRVAKPMYQQSRQVAYKLIRSLLYAMYSTIEQAELSSPRSLDERAVLFFEDALAALDQLAQVAMPFYIQLQEMNYRPLVTLLVSYKPGAAWFFTGGWLLLFGLLAAFYSNYRRIWLVFRAEPTRTTVSVAGMSHRRAQAFAREFTRLASRIQKALDKC